MAPVGFAALTMRTVKPPFLHDRARCSPLVCLKPLGAETHSTRRTTTSASSGECKNQQPPAGRADTIGMTFPVESLAQHALRRGNGWAHLEAGRRWPNRGTGPVRGWRREGRARVAGAPIKGRVGRPARGGNGVERRGASDWATQKSDAIAADLFEVRVCATCHGVSRTGDASVPFAIAPVALTRDWLPKARFDHASHDTVDCARCHGAATSKASAEVLMPVLATCQACHAGATPTRGKIASDCQACHGFHAGNAGLIPTTSPTGAVSRPLPAPPTNGKPAHP